MWLLLSLTFAAGPLPSWGPCTGIDTADGAECATMAVPEDYGDIGEGVGVVHVTVARLPSEGSVSKHLWVTAPDLGGSAITALAQWAGRELPNDVQVYAVDHRGAGATRLSCPEQEDPRSVAGTVIHASEIEACGRSLEPQTAGLAYIDTTQSAGDLLEVSERLAEGADQFFVGRGYGAFLLQRALVLSGRPEGVILDGPWPDDASLSDLDQDVDVLAQRILGACDADLACAVSEPLDELATAFSSSPDACRGDAPRRLAQLAMGPPDLQALLPTALERLVRCNADDREVLDHLASALDEELSHPGDSPALALHVGYGELWRWTDADAPRLASTGRSEAMARAAQQWPLPFAPRESRYPDHPRPVLLLQPESAPLSDEQVFDRYTWREHHVVPVAGAFGSALETACGMELLRSFLSDPTVSPGACSASLSFEADPAIDRQWLGVDDRWVRSGCGCTSRPSSLPGLEWLRRR